jgi:hypothetical protein
VLLRSEPEATADGHLLPAVPGGECGDGGRRSKLFAMCRCGPGVTAPGELSMRAVLRTANGEILLLERISMGGVHQSLTNENQDH